MEKFWLSGMAALGVIAAPSADACSICRCGDPTFNALGSEGVAQSGLRLALDWDEVEKSQGSESDEFSKIRETRTTLLVAHGLSDRYSIFLRVPFSDKDLTEIEEGETERVQESGLGDPEISGQARLWASKFDAEVGVRNSLYLTGGVKTDWGENDAERDGERLDEHVQPGTGSVDWFVGLSGSHLLDRRSALFASAQYRHTGRNDHGYRYGRVTLLNVAYEHKLGERWDMVLEANYRDAGRDQVDREGTLDPDTGGSIVYVTPRLLFDLGGGWVLRAAAQVPVSESGLNGVQDEREVVNIGVTKLFTR